jgi:hypothetical protein
MYIDSQITEEIIKEFVDNKVPILSVHDSYIVETDRVDFLRDAMSKATIKLVGRDLAVEQEVPSYNNIMAMQSVDRDRYIDTFKDVLAMTNKTDQYSNRIIRFMKYRTNNYQDTYWIGT